MLDRNIYFTSSQISLGTYKIRASSELEDELCEKKV